MALAAWSGGVRTGVQGQMRFGEVGHGWGGTAFLGMAVCAFRGMVGLA